MHYLHSLGEGCARVHPKNERMLSCRRQLYHYSHFVYLFIASSEHKSKDEKEIDVSSRLCKLEDAGGREALLE